MALQNYHETHGLFPPLMIWGGPPGEPLGSGVVPVGAIDCVALGIAPGSEPDRMYANWAILLLPFIDQQPLYNKYHFGRPVDDASQSRVRTTKLSVMLCPSDSYNETPYERALLAGVRGHEYARGNYAMNFGPNNGCYKFQANCPDGLGTATPDIMHTNSVVWGSGVGGVNRSFRLRDFGGGVSNMVALDEIRAGIDPVDSRGVRALGFVGASVTALHGKHLGGGVVNRHHSRMDGLVSCTDLELRYSQKYLSRVGMPCSSSPYGANFGAIARSLHPLGVNVALLDGAFRFVNENIHPNVWHAWHSRDARPAADLSF